MPPILTQLWQAREVLVFLVWTRLRSRYAQSVLGAFWLLARPILSMVVMTIFFGHVAGLRSDNAPYALFTFVALVPWFYFSGTLVGACSGLSTYAYLFKQTTLPRILALLIPVCERLPDLAASLLVMLVMLFAWGMPPNAGIVLLPLFVLIMILTALGVALCLAPLALQYRDIGYAINVGVQVLIYATPVIYSVSLVPPQYRLLYGLYPMVGVIEGFRASLLGTAPLPWDLVLVGGVASVVMCLAGVTLFLRFEDRFDDVA